MQKDTAEHAYRLSKKRDQAQLGRSSSASGIQWKQLVVVAPHCSATLLILME